MFSRCTQGDNRFVKTEKHVIDDNAFVTYEKRLESFHGWSPAKNPTGEQLAKCGFYLSGGGKHTYYFSCGNSKDDWRSYDNPWTEHALLCSDCLFLQLNRSTPNSYNWNNLVSIREPNSLFENCQVTIPSRNKTHKIS